MVPLYSVRKILGIDLIQTNSSLTRNVKKIGRKETIVSKKTGLVPWIQVW